MPKDKEEEEEKKTTKSRQLVVVEVPQSIAAFAENQDPDELSLQQKNLANLDSIVSLVGDSVEFEYAIGRAREFLPAAATIKRAYAGYEDKDSKEEMQQKMDRLAQIKTTIADEVEGAITFRGEVLEAFNKIEIATDNVCNLWTTLQALSFSDAALDQVSLGDHCDVRLVANQVAELRNLTQKLQEQKADSTKRLTEDIKSLCSFPGSKNIKATMEKLGESYEALNAIKAKIQAAVDTDEKRKADLVFEIQLEDNHLTLKNGELEKVVLHATDLGTGVTNQRAQNRSEAVEFDTTSEADIVAFRESSAADVVATVKRAKQEYADMMQASKEGLEEMLQKKRALAAARGQKGEEEQQAIAASISALNARMGRALTIAQEEIAQEFQAEIQSDKARKEDLQKRLDALTTSKTE